MLRFRVTLLLLLTGIIVLTVLAIGISSYVNSHAAAKQLSDQVLDQTSQRINQQVENLLSKATDQCSLTEQLLKSGQLNPKDFPKLVGYWREVMTTQPEMTSFFIGLENTGEAVGVSRLHRGKLSIWQTERNPKTKSLELREFWATDYPTKPFNQEAVGPDVRTRPWFVSAQQTGRAAWTETYAFLGVEGVKNVMGVTYSSPLQSPDGSLQAVLTADFDLQTLNRFLSTL